MLLRHNCNKHIQFKHMFIPLENSSNRTFKKDELITDQITNFYPSTELNFQKNIVYIQTY